MKTNFNKFFVFVAYVTIFSAISLLLLLIYWHIKPYKVAEFYNLPFPILNENKEVKRGDRVRYLIKYCKDVDANPYLTKYFIDGVVYETPKVPGAVNKGCGQIISDAYVPKAIPAGNYSIKIIAEYQVNPIRKIKITNYTESFIVK